ncbi:MAG: ATP-binding protein [Oscillospiraceae bacterium]|nr:ATP-binding protein [Oscillospiraceae bacterium]
MLIKFSFENFRTFKNETTLSMLATTQRTLNNVLIRKGKHRILPSAVLYGANASGKTNIVLAMQTMQAIVRTGSLDRASNAAVSSLELFPFIHDNNISPMSFGVEFIKGENQFRYKLSICVESLNQTGKRTVFEEKLELILMREDVLLFHRTTDNIVVGADKKALEILKHDNPEELLGLVNSIVRNMDNETLFLTGGFKSTICKEIADVVIDFISDKIMPIMHLPDIAYDNKILIPIENLPADHFLPGIELFDAIVKAADFGPQQIGLRINESDTGKHGLHELEMISKYREFFVPSDLMESAGTIRLLHFSLFLKSFFSHGGTLFIDEMDNAIHPEITKSIIALFGNPEFNKNGAQLIFTTHNPIFMDRDLLRRDQIIFVERDADSYISTLHSLAEFGSVNVRNDQSFMRNYFKGRYGKLPYLDLETILSQGLEN